MPITLAPVAVQFCVRYNKFRGVLRTPLTPYGIAIGHISTSRNTSMDVFTPTGSDQMRKNGCLFLSNGEYYGLAMERQPGRMCCS